MRNFNGPGRRTFNRVFGVKPVPILSPEDQLSNGQNKPEDQPPTIGQPDRKTVLKELAVLMASKTLEGQKWNLDQIKQKQAQEAEKSLVNRVRPHDQQWHHQGGEAKDY